jgi:lipoprotein-anchoring transpeptidase ErfK/SrfK
VVLVALAGAAYAYDHGRRDLIAQGVTIDGIPVGGLRAAAARALVQRRVVQPLQRPVTVVAATRRWQLSSTQAGVTLDAAAMVDDAVRLSRQGSFISRALRGLEGGALKRDVSLGVSYDHAAVRRLDAAVRRALDVAPRDASVAPSAAGLQSVSSRVGVRVNSGRLGAAVERALTDGHAPHRVPVPIVRVTPAVTTARLASAYPTYIVVDRGGFTLRFYDHLRLMRSYAIAVGMQGLQTPAGLYHIQWKQVDPPWYVPNSSWAGALAGKTIPPGPQDPLKARFMSFDGGAGIHGIDPSEYGTIGHNASHGCVRMTIPDVIDLYARSPVGTPVFVA